MGVCCKAEWLERAKEISEPKPRQKRLLILGMGRAGKDEACAYLEKITTLRNAGTTSRYLCRFVAERLGIIEEEAYARRHESDEMRMFWYKTGNEIREGDPTVLLREALKHGEITGGLRDKAEVIAAREQGLVDHIIWIDNKRVPVDPTVMFSERECDFIIPNHWSLEEYHARLDNLAKALSLPMRRNCMGPQSGS